MRTFLQEAMTAKQVSTIELYTKSGISMKQIERFLSDKLTPSLMEAARLALALEITIDELVNGLNPIVEEKEPVKEEVNMEKEIEAIEEELTAEEFESDDEDEEVVDPKEAFELALKLNAGVNVVSTTDIAEAYRLLKNLEKLCIEKEVFVQVSEDLEDKDRFYYHIYIAYEVFDDTFKNVHDLSKSKMFEKLPSNKEMVEYIETDATLL